MTSWTSGFSEWVSERPEFAQRTVWKKFTANINFRAYICVFPNMVKKYKKSKRTPRDSRPELVGDSIFVLLERMGGNPQKARFATLWKCWIEVVGEDFAWITPLGHHEDVLLLAVENAMEIQELNLQAPLILEKINGWLGREYFSRLRVTVRGEDGQNPQVPGS